jgi:hypothetical protein
MFDPIDPARAPSQASPSRTAAADIDAHRRASLAFVLGESERAAIAEARDRLNRPARDLVAKLREMELERLLSFEHGTAAPPGTLTITGTDDRGRRIRVTLGNTRKISSSRLAILASCHLRSLRRVEVG